MTPSKGTSFWVWLTIGLIGLGLNAFARKISPRASRPGQHLNCTGQLQISSTLRLHVHMLERAK